MELDCIHQGTMFASNMNMVISRCNNENSPYFAQAITPAFCKMCPKYQEPTENEKESRKLFLAQFIKNDGSQRSQEEVDSIFKIYCSNCKLLAPDSLQCQGCGCFKGLPITELARLATTHCPLNLW